MTQGKYANVNGLKLYYEIHGQGQPLILLHGGFGVIGMFEQNLPALAANRQVIGVELQGHGHTADINRPLSFEQMADDVAALVKHLGIEKADVFGYSLGGGVALQTAIRQHWPGAVLQGRSGGNPTDIHAIYNLGSNLINQGCDIRKSIAALEKIDFIVSHEIFMTPTARYCDVIFPAAAPRPIGGAGRMRVRQGGRRQMRTSGYSGPRQIQRPKADPMNQL